MKVWPKYPVLFEINTWVWLHNLGVKYNKKIDLGNIPGEEIEILAQSNFDAVWLMGVWKRSPGARQVARETPVLHKEYRHALPGYTEDDIVGSPYAILAYEVDPQLGTCDGLTTFREQLQRNNMNLVLDFVPNHLALDHMWCCNHPGRLIQGSEKALRENPGSYYRLNGDEAGPVFAHGSEVHYRWTDTVQVDYRKRDTREAMIRTLLEIAQYCDGVRCDMAMLQLHDVFLRIWGGSFDEPGIEFWQQAISAVKRKNEGFLFIGEVYWGMEYQLQQLGFDFIYDKVLYDRVLGDNPSAIRAHLAGGSSEFQDKLVRFTENHDEKRIMNYAGLKQSLAAAVITYTVPGLRLFHNGQFAGNQLKLPVQLGRCIIEEAKPATEVFYKRLLSALREPIFQIGTWHVLENYMTAPGNHSYANFVTYVWYLDNEALLVAVNISEEPSQCFIPLNMKWIVEKKWILKDLLNDYEYSREGITLVAPGLYLDVPGFGYHLFKFKPFPG